MKKFSVVFFTILLVVSNFYAQPKPVNEWYWVDKQSGTNKDNKTELLTGIDMVTITNVPTKYVIGENTQSFTAKVTVPAYEMNKYETTYQLWYKVLQEAQKRGYEFANPGQEGSMGRRGKAPTEEGKTQPVVTINWRDVIVWCNALSEIQGLKPCYTYEGKVIKSSVNAAEADLVKCDWNANGFRLPSEAEWEYAARKTKDGLMRGDEPSGNPEPQNPDGKNPKNRLLPLLTLAISDSNLTPPNWANINSDKTNAVATSGTTNYVGLFDMTGNVLEFCWDWYGFYSDSTTFSPDVEIGGPEFGKLRTSRGGSWNLYTPFFLAGDRYAFDPSEAYNYLGFRLCRTLSNSR